MAFKMKANPGGPMRKNFPSAFKQDKKTKEEMTDKEVADALIRNAKKKPGSLKEFVTANDSVNLMSDELKRRFETQSE